MTYHESIIDLISYILKQGKPYLDFIDSGNAYDKIIRNYHQFNYEGKKVYRNKTLIRIHYRISKEAYNKINDFSSIYFEHVYPVKLLKEELRMLQKGTVTHEKIKLIMNKSEIVVLTREQAKKIDIYYKDKIPENGNDRLQEMKIEIHGLTKNNNLFN
jgi:hypothetical protein